ncbi:Clp protease ClpP [Parablautia intestinalis]|uniref:ATP-dependent Clp protease proteolytic subunit n=1 Tax=Parablautia intestinalis TaxID=2320100 RepID=A0A3A9B3H3_9FIRM|nr:head maturation protease, ClpP-related [Parablautia intestinalis]RKI94301.1 Clp protease ClpP [Parablautia intestinalis]
MKQQKAHYCFRQEAGSDVHKLYIYDDVSEYGTFDWWTWEYTESETSAEFFRKALAEIPENATIELHINSNGGSVKEGVAIYNQLKQKKCKEIVAYVDGFAYSIASIIMQAADRRIMGLGTSLLIHNMWLSVAGNAKELRKAADDLDVLMESNRQIYLERVNISEDELIEMLDSETYLTPEKAVEMGFADEVGKAEASIPDLTQQLQEQIVQMRREMTAQKAFREDLKQFCIRQQGERDTDSSNSDSVDEAGPDNTGEGVGDSTQDTDSESNDKNQKAEKQFKLAALLGQAAAQYLKER